MITRRYMISVFKKFALSRWYKSTNGFSEGEQLSFILVIIVNQKEEIKYCQICNVMLFLQIEFAVHMTCERCVNAISKSIADLEGIRNVDISLERGTVTLETNLPYSIIQERIERTGRQAVLKGYGGLNKFLLLFISSVLSFSVLYNNLILFMISEDTCF